jgi:hypothetical protein
MRVGWVRCGALRREGRGVETRLKWVPRLLRAAPPGGGWGVAVAARAAPPSRLPASWRCDRASPLAELGRRGWRRSWPILVDLVGGGPPYR